MKRFRILGWKKIVLVSALALFQALPVNVLAKSPVKLKKFIGTIDLAAEGITPFTLEGTASHLGKYKCYGEVTFVPIDDEGTLIGEGVSVFTAANGDLLVGVVTWDVDPEGGELLTSHIHFSWRDSVQFSDGTVVASTGRFVDDRPPGLIVVAIISVLLHLLLPAVQG
jgi:hypothetical protein